MPRSAGAAATSKRLPMTSLTSTCPPPGSARPQAVALKDKPLVVIGISICDISQPLPIAIAELG
jgi:hypothetical protein